MKKIRSSSASEFILHSVFGLILIVLVFVMLYPYFNDFFVAEKPSAINFFVPTNKRPNILSVVNVGLIITEVREFDIFKSKFIFDSLIWFKFKSAEVPLKTIDKFSFERGEILSKEGPQIRITGDYIIATYSIRFSFMTDLSFKLFPLDNHRIFFIMTNSSVQSDELRYIITPENIRFLDKKIAGWKFVSADAKYGYLETKILNQVIDHPVIIFSLDFKKGGLGHLLSILIPFFILYLLAIYSLSSAKFGDGGSVSLAFGNVGAVLAYRFVVQNIAPKVGYLLLTDYLYIFILVVSLMVPIFILLSARKWILRETWLRLRLLLIIFFYISFDIYFIFVFGRFLS